MNATSVLLEPLAGPAAELLSRNLLGEAELAEDARARILEAAEGNPLFIEEMLEMLIDDGLLERRNGSWVATQTSPIWPFRRRSTPSSRRGSIACPARSARW